MSGGKCNLDKCTLKGCRLCRFQVHAMNGHIPTYGKIRETQMAFSQ